MKKLVITLIAITILFVFVACPSVVDPVSPVEILPIEFEVTGLIEPVLDTDILDLQITMDENVESFNYVWTLDGDIVSIENSLHLENLSVGMHNLIVAATSTDEQRSGAVTIDFEVIISEKISISTELILIQKLPTTAVGSTIYGLTNGGIKDYPGLKKVQINVTNPLYAIKDRTYFGGNTLNISFTKNQDDFLPWYSATVVIEGVEKIGNAQTHFSGNDKTFSGLGYTDSDNDGNITVELAGYIDYLDLLKVLPGKPFEYDGRWVADVIWRFSKVFFMDNQCPLIKSGIPVPELQTMSVKIAFTASDAESGISFLNYRVRLSGEKYGGWIDYSGNQIEIADLLLGENLIQIRAVDYVGNTTINTYSAVVSTQ